MFRSEPDPQLKEMLEKGAILLDVRTEEEYEEGHAEPSINIPLDRLIEDFTRLNKEVPVVVVCQSGIRSEHAAAFLQQKAFREVVNGGSWYDFL